jgi:hypothetical protein
MGFFKTLMSVISTDGKTGTPFNFDKNHTVYFKGDGVTKVDAARVAGFFKGYGYFTETNQSDVQIFSKELNGPVEIGFIIGGSSVSKETEIFFKATAAGLQDSFPGRTITGYLLDTNVKQLKEL